MSPTLSTLTPEVWKPDPFWIMLGDGKVKECLRLLTRSHRRTFPHLDLLSRADFGDLGEALDLFSRMIDELD